MRGQILGKAYLDATLRFGLGELPDRREVGEDESTAAVHSCFTSTRELGGNMNLDAHEVGIARVWQY